MPFPPPFRRRGSRDPYRNQVLGVVVRQAEREPSPLKLTEPRVKLMRAIEAKEVKLGKGRFAQDWRWRGDTVTQRVNLIIRAGWAEPKGAHVELTEAGRVVLKEAS